MKYVKLILAILILVTMANAKNNDTKPNKKVNKSIQKQNSKSPEWSKMNSFHLKTSKGYKVHLLSTKKGFLFDKGKGKITMLILVSSECKSCLNWLVDIQKIEKHYNKDMKVYVLSINNVDRQKMEKAIKNKTINPKVMKGIISKNNAVMNKLAKKYKLSLPIISIMSTKENLQFALQTIYKFQFFKPRGKLKKRAALPFNIVFGPEGQTVGITAGTSKPKAYQDYIGKLIKHYKSKK